jgi:hypothetical protein
MSKRLSLTRRATVLPPAGAAGASFWGDGRMP